jgi:ABC-type sugar transport system substrate-binding protein
LNRLPNVNVLEQTMPQDSTADVQTQIASLRTEIARQKAVVKSSLGNSPVMTAAIQTLRELSVRLVALERKHSAENPKN